MRTIIQDTRFLTTLSRRFCGRSRLLDGATIIVVRPGTGLEIHINNGIASMACLGWQDDEAFVIDRYSHPRFLSSAAVHGLEDALTQFVGRFLRRHLLITSTRKQGAA